mmetsp:Transcript_31300/g.101930  ORF Transcript_31300/g.101930 Transcript_31300/m.101930 type:complete len:201 (+) Transcript_31300:204-806(+)
MPIAHRHRWVAQGWSNNTPPAPRAARRPQAPSTDGRGPSSELGTARGGAARRTSSTWHGGHHGPLEGGRLGPIQLPTGTTRGTVVPQLHRAAACNHRRPRRCRRSQPHFWPQPWLHLLRALLLSRLAKLPPTHPARSVSPCQGLWSRSWQHVRVPANLPDRPHCHWTLRAEARCCQSQGPADQERALPELEMRLVSAAPF